MGKSQWQRQHQQKPEERPVSVPDSVSPVAPEYTPNPEVNRVFEPFLKPTVPEPPPSAPVEPALRGYPGSVKTGGNIELHPKK